MSSESEARRIVHLVSDSTGDTAAAAVGAVLSQFEDHPILTRAHVFVRSAAKVDEALVEIHAAGDLAVVTMIDSVLRKRLTDGCAAAGVESLELLEPLFTSVARLLGGVFV